MHPKGTTPRSRAGKIAAGVWRLLYSGLISPFLHALSGGGSQGCRFEPTCGEYMSQALETHGVFSGIILGIKRVLRCHPWSQGGSDPVPPRR